MGLVSSSVALRRSLNSRSNIAPVALFVYNRPEHTQKTISSLQENELASQSDLFVFSDGPKDQAGSAAVQRVRRYISGIQGFKSVRIFERERNLGLANSVIVGITQLCHEFGRVIAVEDDLLTTPDFLTFMNQALERYERETRMFSVSGFNFAFKAPEQYEYDAFCFYRSSSLGWGTWKDRWELVDWRVSDYESFCTDRERQRLFNRGGEDLSSMLALQMHGKINSWAIRWAYAHFKQDALALLSLQPRVFHIGADRAATNQRRNTLKQLPLTTEHKSEFRYPEAAMLEEPFVRALQRSLRPSLARKVARYFLHGRSGLTTNRFAFAKSSPVRTAHSPSPVVGRRTLDD